MNECDQQKYTSYCLDITRHTE